MTGRVREISRLRVAWRRRVKGLADIHILSLQAHNGIEGVITVRALYECKLDLAAAIQMVARG